MSIFSISNKAPHTIVKRPNNQCRIIPVAFRKYFQILSSCISICFIDILTELSS